MSTFEVNLDEAVIEESREARLIAGKSKDSRFTNIQFGDSKLAFKGVTKSGRKVINLIADIMNTSQILEDEISEDDLDSTLKAMSMPEKIVELLCALSATPAQAAWLKDEDLKMDEIYSLFEVINNTPEGVAVAKK